MRKIPAINSSPLLSYMCTDICTHMCTNTRVDAIHTSQMWWCTAAYPALTSGGKEDQESKASLGYLANSKPVWATGDPVSNKTKYRDSGKTHKKAVLTSLCLAFYFHSAYKLFAFLMSFHAARASPPLIRLPTTAGSSFLGKRTLQHVTHNSQFQFLRSGTRT